MENQTQKNSATKKESGQPTYGDKPWQTPDQKDQKDPQKDESCGCGRDSEKGNIKGNKKDTATKRG